MKFRYPEVLLLAMLMGSSCSQKDSDAGATTPERTPPADQRDGERTTETATATSRQVPEALRSLIPPDSAILAYKSLDGTTTDLAVVIVRGKPGDDTQKNPCELLVLKDKSGVFSVEDKTDKAVDCLYNDLARKAASLEENLQVAPGKISYNNQGEKSTARYDFAFSDEKDAWHLSKAESAYPKYNEATDSTEVLGSEANFPKDFGWIPMSSFDPELIREAMEKNRKLIE